MNNWDIYFLRIAKEVKEQSKCLSRKIGAILVKDKAIISTGYNGPARNVKHCNERTLDFYVKLNNIYYSKNELEKLKGGREKIDKCPRKFFGYKSGQGLHLCQASHAERNALIQAARNGISTLNSSLYCYCTLPCKDCMIEIINAGVKKIVCLKGEDYDKYSRVIANEAYITIKQIDEKEIENA